MSTKATKTIKAPVITHDEYQVDLEVGNDCRNPYIAKLVPEVKNDKFARDGLSRDLFEGSELRKSTFKANNKIIVTRLHGKLPVGTILESRGWEPKIIETNQNLRYWAVTPTGLVEVDGYDNAKQLIK
jgi:hypothetical protein